MKKVRNASSARKKVIRKCSDFPSSESVSEVSDTEKTNEVHRRRSLFGMVFDGEAQ